MTTEQLLDFVSGYRWAGSGKVQITPDDTYRAATFAQQEILGELLLLEGAARLKLVSGQATYTFPAVTATLVTPGAPIQLRVPSHSFNTGDSVIVYGVVGTTGANGRFTATKVDASNITLDGSNDATAWTSGGAVLHALAGAKMIMPHGIRKVTADGVAVTGVIVKKLRAFMELHRSKFGSLSGDNAVLYFSEEYTNPITLDFLGTPSLDIVCDVPYYRKPTVAEAVSATVNPIIPDEYQKLLVLGTLYHLFDFMDSKEAEAASVMAYQKFAGEKNRVQATHLASRLVQYPNLSGLEA